MGRRDRPTCPQMLGVDKFTESGVIIKLMVKTHPERIFPVRRELLRRVKNAFDEEGIEISGSPSHSHASKGRRVTP